MTTLDRLRQPHPGREHQGRTPPLSRRLRVTIDPTNRPSIDWPSITDPGHAPPARCALAGLRHPPSARPHPPKTHVTTKRVARSWLKNAGPPHPPRRLDLQPFDKRPVSIHLDLALWTRTSVACWAAIRSHRPMVSYLWPVISSAALKLPRRITTSRVRATSATQAIHRRAQGNERPQF